MSAVDPRPATAPDVTEDPRRLSLRVLGRPSLGWWAVVLVLSAVVGNGIYAWIHQLRYGMGSAGYSDQAFWAIYIADVIAFIGVSYGGAVVSAILRLTGAGWRAPLTRLAEGAAVCTVLVGAALIVPHIGHPDRLYELVTRPNVSAPVFWDFIAVSTYTTASIIFFALPLIPDTAAMLESHADRLGRARGALYRAIARGWLGTPRQRQVLGKALGLISVVIIPLAVSVHSVLAWAFATTSRPWWHESIWAPQFVVAALYSGVALVILVVAAFRSGYRLHAYITEQHFVRLGYLMASLGAGYLYFTFADFLPGGYVGENQVSAIFGELLVGRLAGWFWLFLIGGAVIPLLLVALPWTRHTTGIVVAAAFVVPMLWLKRLLMVIAPANFDVVTGEHGAYHFTWVPVSITLAATAAVPLLLMLMFRVVPVLSIDELEEQAAEDHPAPAGADEGPRRARSLAGTAGAVLLLALVGTGLTVGDAPPAAAATTPPSGPSIVLAGTEQDGLVSLTATVRDGKGAPVTAGSVRFLFTSTTFGPRQVPLTSVQVGKDGTARLVLDGEHSGGWRPTTVGPAEFIASFTAAPGDQPLETSTNVDVTVAYSAYTPAPPKPLEGVGAVLPKALGTLVAAVWLALLSTVLRVLAATRRRPAMQRSAARSTVPATRPVPVDPTV